MTTVSGCYSAMARFGRVVPGAAVGGLSGGRRADGEAGGLDGWPVREMQGCRRGGMVMDVHGSRTDEVLELGLGPGAMNAP